MINKCFDKFEMLRAPYCCRKQIIDMADTPELAVDEGVSAYPEYENTNSNSSSVLVLANYLTKSELTLLDSSLFQQKLSPMRMQPHLLYVNPSIPSYCFQLHSMITLNEKFADEAKETLADVGERLKISTENCWIAKGRIFPELKQMAIRLKAAAIYVSEDAFLELRRSVVLVNRSHSIKIYRIKDFF